MRTDRKQKAKSQKFKQAKFDFARLIAMLGGSTNTSRLLDAYNYRPAKRNTIESWKIRNSMPLDRFADLLGVARDMDLPISANDLLEVYVD